MPSRDFSSSRQHRSPRRTTARHLQGFAGAAVLALCAMAQGAWAASPSCRAQSGLRMAALVELYTSEGCSSCPPADRRLRELPGGLDADALAVPAALHVDYWDDIGWRDPYADRAHADRQRRLVRANGHRTVVTPHFFVSGHELREGASGLRDAVRAVNAKPSPVDLALELVPSREAITVRATATWRASTGVPTPSELVVAVTEAGLTSHVLHGENRGVTLEHDHVVRAWRPPQALEGGSAVVRQSWPWGADWRRDQLAVLAFVQVAGSGPVQQAVRLPVSGCGS